MRAKSLISMRTLTFFEVLSRIQVTDRFFEKQLFCQAALAQALKNIRGPYRKGVYPSSKNANY